MLVNWYYGRQRQCQVLGKDHLDVGKQLCNLAAICCHTKKYKEAVDCYKEALEIFSGTLGPENPYTVKTKNNLASLYVETENYKEAEKLYKEILSYMPQELSAKPENEVPVLEAADKKEVKQQENSVHQKKETSRQNNVNTLGFAQFLMSPERLDGFSMNFDHVKKRLEFTFYSEDSVTRAFRGPTRN
ncbi:Kinesin light chain [Araneus ventricosus]|uniref:Kinesin light chain n=1 Tax=Araneus ventricosus TaxID=182803 RepID=A0A4Y2WPS5_ARAVE|nr:Kinesin light chain [Araneus ventricosus]